MKRLLSEQMSALSRNDYCRWTSTLYHADSGRRRVREEAGRKPEDARRLHGPLSNVRTVLQPEICGARGLKNKTSKRVTPMRKIVEVETREEKLDERKNEIEARGKSLEISLYIRRIETQLAYGISRVNAKEIQPPAQPECLYCRPIAYRSTTTTRSHRLSLLPLPGGLVSRPLTLDRTATTYSARCPALPRLVSPRLVSSRLVSSRFVEVFRKRELRRVKRLSSTAELSSIDMRYRKLLSDYLIRRVCASILNFDEILHVGCWFNPETGDLRMATIFDQFDHAAKNGKTSRGSGSAMPEVGLVLDGLEISISTPGNRLERSRSR
ncbi:hypothetical protein EAG_15761 [Camponotus floridanus]|uniref:Uncharacterized protein n=1 Tax=Camponotus floridanus TaxID=104421 RepID=E2AXF2_CAMFO|nr:hypothetical protein EAG_15761 [Camponotus floridanus]